MFVGACFPLVDARPFVAGDTGQLVRPTWPNIALPRRPELARDRDFVRACGPAENRRRGGPDRWPGEHAYVRSGQLMRFVGELGGDADDPVLHGARCTFRRLYCAPPARARFEVGIRLHSMVDMTQPIEAVLDAVGSIPIRVQPKNVNGQVDTKHVPLVDAGSSLAPLYARATTSRSFGGTPEDWWVAPADPLFVVETGSPVAAEQLRSLGAVQRPDAPAGTMLLHVYDESAGVSVWLMAHESGMVTTDPELRNLRIHLVRLHEERETFKRVLQMLARKQLTLQGEAAGAQELDAYLTATARSFERDSFQGVGIEGTLRVAFQAEALVGDAEWASLRDAFEQSRRRLGRAVERIVQADVDRQPNQPSVTVQIFNGSVNVTDDHSVNIGGQGDITLTGVQIATGEQINQSLRDVESSGASEEMKATLEEIHNELAKLLPQLTDDQARKAAASFEVLANAPVEAKPDRKWYEVSASGLLEAANAVADAGKPLIGLIGKLFGLAG